MNTIDNIIGVTSIVNKQILIESVKELTNTIINFNSMKDVLEKENKLLDMIDNLPIVRNNT